MLQLRKLLIFLAARRRHPAQASAKGSLRQFRVPFAWAAVNPNLGLASEDRGGSTHLSPMRAPDRSLRTQLWNLAERRRYLAGLDALVRSLRSDAERLTAAAAQSNDPEGREAARAGREIVERSITDLEAQLAAARTAVAEALLAVKHHETAGRTRTAHARTRRPRRR
jgi:hypothetical protein